MAEPFAQKPAEPKGIPRPQVLPPARVEPVKRDYAPGSGLLWSEWYAHSKLILIFITAWLAAVWLLPLFTNPGWILAFGLIYALIAGPALGGGDVIEGCEEFAFALPASRSERYLARLLVGGGILLMFTLLDILVLGLDLAQAIVRLYLDTGLIRPIEILKPQLLYGLVFAFPFAVFSIGFSLSANARGRALVFTGWFWAGLVALIVLKLGLSYEYWSWGAWTGFVACSALIITGAAALWTGHAFFRGKEIVPASSPFIMPNYWWLWLLLIACSLALTAILVVSLSQELAKVMKQ
jgi:hypothetical protein